MKPIEELEVAQLIEDRLHRIKDIGGLRKLGTRVW